MKKIALVVLILAGMVLIVNGCSKKEETTEPATEAVQPAQKAVTEQAPSIPAPASVEEPLPDSEVAEAMGQMEQTGEAIIEQGKQMIQETADTAKEQLESEVNKQVEEIKDQATEKIEEIMPKDAATKALEDTLKEKAGE